MGQGNNKTRHKYIFLYPLVLISLLVLGCATTVLSPHAQNEMIAPYNVAGEKQELGGAFAYNKWVVDKIEEEVYIKTYPSASFSFFHNASYAWRMLSGIGGIELIGAPLPWTDPDESGFAMYLRPYAGFQFNGSIATCRLNFSPLIAGALCGDGEWRTGGDLSEFTIYQFTCLLHNPQPATHTFWGGFRIAPRALGLVGGYEYTINASTVLRTEYSYLGPKLFQFASISDEEEVKGEVHYLTLGFFKRVK